MTRPQLHSIEELKDLLLARLEAIVEHYAPRAADSFTDNQGRYFTLNPGRADKSVGSFCVTMAGTRAGHWRDYATGDHGDILDLIRLNLSGDMVAAIKEARSYLGLENDTPDMRRRREEEAAKARARRAEAERQRRADQARRSRQALALWLSGQEFITRTPVEHYLRDARGIDVRQLARPPRALRFVPRCFYTHTDQETGEVLEDHLPAMVAIVTNGAGKPIACHRTYLAIDAKSGTWGKAPVPKAKKVLGDYPGGFITLSTGTGPRGGKAPSLAKAPAGTHVYIAEGIEDALSASLLLPDARVLAGISLSNLGQVDLPACVSSVTLIADRDENEEARRALERAIDAHAQAGRSVRLWQNASGGKDLNDALRRLRDEGHGQRREAG